MVLNYILSLLLAPALAVLIVVIIRATRGKDKYPGLIVSFLLGMISLVVVLLFQYIADSFGLNIFSNIRRIIFYSFIVMGFGSELGKYLVLNFDNLPFNSLS